MMTTTSTAPILPAPAADVSAYAPETLRALALNVVRRKGKLLRWELRVHASGASLWACYRTRGGEVLSTSCAL
jgi:hypothetical protein